MVVDGWMDGAFEIYEICEKTDNNQHIVVRGGEGRKGGRELRYICNRYERTKIGESIHNTFSQEFDNTYAIAAILRHHSITCRLLVRTR